MKKGLFLIFGMLLIISCGYKEGTIQKSDKSFLKFTGNWENTSVQVDHMAPFVLSSMADSGGDADKNLYQILPGKHTLKVYRNGNIVINRIIILENQATMEVQIP